MTDSAIVSMFAPVIAGSYFIDPNDVYTERQFMYTDGGTETVDEVEALRQYVGRTYPLLESTIGETQAVALTMTVPFTDWYTERDLMQWWRDRKRAGRTLLYRDGRSRSFPVVISGPVTIAPRVGGWIVTCTLQRVDYPLSQSYIAASDYYPSATTGGWNAGGWNTQGWNT